MGSVAASLWRERESKVVGQSGSIQVSMSVTFVTTFFGRVY